MLKATRAFKDSITNYPKEPSLRIGRCVPDNAVNLAYYYNPTATDGEKVLTAEAPRNTIDHRVEDAYRYLFNQASDDDNLFPGSVLYEDEDGYKGLLGRMYVNWYPEAHISTKNIQFSKDEIVVNKSEIPKMYEYSDDDGYTGNAYLDATKYEVTKVKDISTVEVIEREVLNHELNYHEIFGNYINPNNLDTWMKSPGLTETSMWPKNITVDFLKLIADDCNTQIKSFVDSMYNMYDDAIGVLEFTSLEYEQVYTGASQSGTVNNYNISSTFSNESEKDVVQNMTIEKAYDIFKTLYESHYDSTTNEYDYSEIEDFIDMANKYCSNSNAIFFTRISDAISNNKDIAIYMNNISIKVDDSSDSSSDAWYEASYKYTISTKGSEGAYQYNVVANYSGVLSKNIVTTTQEAIEYKANCNYTGIARKVWYDYDGVAYYRGAVTKGNGIGNVNSEGNNEILMYPDENGYLRIPTEVTNEDGEVSIRNFYEVESDYIYLTDVFKDGVACFYKYPLKLPIYNSYILDDNESYKGNAIKIFTSNLKDIADNQKYNIKLKVAEYENVSNITNDFQTTTKEVPKRYNAELYTSFISNSTDTFQVLYNAFDDSDTNNIALDNGVSENIYNYPFMLEGVDFTLESVEQLTRINKIRLTKPSRIKDTRRYITFSYTITAERKSDGKKFTTSEYTTSILNKDYAVPFEYNKFDERAMIISPKIDGILASPFDLVLQDQAVSGIEPIITLKDNDFLFYTTITKISKENIGAVNLKCNTDGSGYITAETTIETGFWNDKTGTYTKKLCMDNPYYIEEGYIYPAFKVKCIDTKHIKVETPRHDGLLESWYPRIQFGHYSQVLDQYGAHTKVFYTMPEYDNQYYSQIYGKPYVDISKEKVTILNPHMVKTQCFPLFIKEGEVTISLFKRLDDELFKINIKDISFSDGIIITEDTISENDDIVCDYTYMEEYYTYRGFWRNINDFARIDLNPNKYHTYSDLNYTPSETKPSKNLFNKVIHFFMRPSLKAEGEEVIDTDVIIDSSNDNLLSEVYNTSDLLMFKTNNNDVTVFTGSEKESKWTNVNGTIQGITNEACLYIFKTTDYYKAYEHTVTMKSTDSDNDCLVVVISAIETKTGYNTLSLVCRLNASETHVSLSNNIQFALVYNYYQASQIVLMNDSTFTSTGGWKTFPNGITVKIIKDVDGTIKIYRTEMNKGTGESLNTSSMEPVIVMSMTDIIDMTEVDFTEGAIGYGNVSQSAATFQGISVGTYSANYTTHIEYNYSKPVIKNTETLYHQIDNAQPESDDDIYIGSVYIRQNTSLQSTVLVDSRSRGGGVIESMKDSLRKELEPESDYYLDIGYYDGEPYQENGVVIIRLDNSILKEFGGRFTQSDVETKVKRWLGFGVYPIIEYVDSYSLRDMPQHNLIVEDSYTNVTNETPQIFLECVENS